MKMPISSEDGTGAFLDSMQLPLWFFRKLSPQERAAVMNVLLVLELSSSGDCQDDVLKEVYKPKKGKSRSNKKGKSNSIKKAKKANEAGNEQAESAAVDCGNLRTRYRKDLKVYHKFLKLQVAEAMVELMAGEFYWSIEQLPPGSLVKLNEIQIRCACTASAAMKIAAYLEQHQVLESSKSTKGIFTYLASGTLKLSQTFHGRIGLCEAAQELFEDGVVCLDTCTMREVYPLKISTKTKNEMIIQLDLSDISKQLNLRKVFKALEDESKANLKQGEKAIPNVAFMVFFAEYAPEFTSVDSWLNYIVSHPGPMNYPRLYRYYLDADAMLKLPAKMSAYTRKFKASLPANDHKQMAPRDYRLAILVKQF